MDLCMENILYKQDHHFICNQLKWAPLYSLCARLYMFHITNFCESGKFSIKCVEKYDASAEGARRNFLVKLIDPHNLL